MKSIMLAVLVALALPGASQAQLSEKKVLTLAAAKTMAAAAEAEAAHNGWNLVIVILDEGGNLLYLERMDGVQLASLQVAQAKARTALLYRRPTRDFAERMAAGNTPLAMPEVMPLEGGLPIVVNGVVIGSIAASGATGAQDAQAVQKGIDALLAKFGN